MKNTLFRTLATASTAVALLFAGAAVTAQAQQTPPATPPAASELDDATLKNFAKASLEVEAVVAEWTPRIEEASSQEEVEQLREQANGEMVEAVQSSGIDVETYNQVYQAAQADPELAKTIMQYREEAQ